MTPPGRESDNRCVLPPALEQRRERDDVCALAEGLEREFLVEREFLDGPAHWEEKKYCGLACSLSSEPAPSP